VLADYKMERSSLLVLAFAVMTCWLIGLTKSYVNMSRQSLVVAVSLVKVNISNLEDLGASLKISSKPGLLFNAQ